MGEDREKYSCTEEPKLARTRGAVIAVWAILAFAVWPILWGVVLAGGWSAMYSRFLVLHRYGVVATLSSVLREARSVRRTFGLFQIPRVRGVGERPYGRMPLSAEMG